MVAVAVAVEVAIRDVWNNNKLPCVRHNVTSTNIFLRYTGACFVHSFCEGTEKILVFYQFCPCRLQVVGLQHEGCALVIADDLSLGVLHIYVRRSRRFEGGAWAFVVYI